MRYLLDTHTLLWWWDNDPRLSTRCREIMGDARNTLFVSAVSALEIAIKFRIGQLPQMAGRIDLYEGGLIEDGLSRLPISTEHGLRAGLLDAEHRDPFDRVLAAQALVEDLTLLTRDSRIPAFGCKVLW